MVGLRVFLTGDTHGDDIGRFKRNRIETYDDFTKNDYMIVLGDFGVPWVNHKNKNLNSLHRTDKKLIQFYNDCPWTTLFVPGNHENYYNLSMYPEVQLEFCIDSQAKVKKISDSIYMLNNGFYQFGEKLIYTFGGATSIDRQYRIDDVSWWKEEVPTHGELNKYFDEFVNFGKIPNYILSHTTHSISIETLIIMMSSIGLDISKKRNCPVSSYLTNIIEYITKHDKNNDYKWNYCGHFHVEKILKVYKTIVLYHSIVELDISEDF